MLKRPLNYSVSLVVALLCAWLPFTPWGEAFAAEELRLQFYFRGTRVSTAPVILVAIDDATVSRAWKDEPRVAWGTHYAVVAERLLKGGAKRVFLDVSFPFDMDVYLEAVAPAAPRPNQRLIRCLMDHPGKVVIGKGILPVSPSAMQAGEENGSNIEFAALAAGGVGWTNLAPLTAGRVRDCLLFLPLETDPTFARPGVAALLAAKERGVAGYPTAQDLARLAPRHTLLQTESEPVPTYVFGINWLRQPLPVLSASAVESDALSPDQRALLRGSIALIGFTDTGSPDRYASGGGGEMPGVQVHAEALATLLDDRALYFPPIWLGSLLAFLAGGAIALVLPRLQMRAAGRVAALGFVAFAALVAAAQWAFAAADVALPLTPIAVALIGVSGSHFVLRSWEEHSRWRDLRLTLYRFFSPPIAEYLLASEENLQPGGKNGTATCLFLDLRDSTRFAASRPPELVMRELNEMFGILVPEIESRAGCVVKYIGDGLLALFNIPQQSAEGDGGAQAAVDAAIAMQQAMFRFNQARLQSAPDAFSLIIGIGIHTGPLVYGNLGSVNRPEFTVIGDTVNVASRLEGLTKQEAVNAPIVVSEATFQALSRRPAATGPVIQEARGHGPFVVRGLFVSNLEA